MIDQTIEQIAEKILRIAPDSSAQVSIGWDDERDQVAWISFSELRALAEAARTK